MRRRKGFTLIELIITIAIAPILFAAVFGIAAFAARSNNQSAANQDIQFRAQEIIENIKARKDISFLLADSAALTPPQRGEIADFTDITIKDETDLEYEKDLTVYEQRADIMGRDFTIRLEDRVTPAEKISQIILPKNSTLLIPSPDEDGDNKKFDINIHTDPEIWCEYRGVIFSPDVKEYKKQNGSDTVLFQHFYLIAQGDSTDAQSIKIIEDPIQADQHIVIDVIYAAAEKEGNAITIEEYPAVIEPYDPEHSAPISALIPDITAPRVNFASNDGKEINWTNPKPDGDAIGWLQTENHSLILTFTDTDGRVWSKYETNY